MLNNAATSLSDSDFITIPIDSPPPSNKTPLIKKNGTNPTVVKTSDLWKMVISQTQFPLASASGAIIGMTGLSIYCFSTDALISGAIYGSGSIISSALITATYYKLVSALKKEEHPEQVKVGLYLITL